MMCSFCGEEICEHGGCWCEDRNCSICARHRELEADAEREANWQRNVIGPMFGFDQESDES